MKSVFITGIPASGKTYISSKLNTNLGIEIINTDKLRKEMLLDPKLEPWVNLLFNLDEEEYYLTTNCEQQWSNIVNQSEAFWPTIINLVNSKKSPFVIEGVNILPHLAKRDFDFSGICLLGESEEIILERIKVNPRWGLTEDLQKMEANAFFHCEGKMYKSETEKYGYKCFTNSDEAYDTLVKMIMSDLE